MPKIGKYDAPAIGPDATLEALRRVSETKVNSPSGVAEILGHSSDRSGAFLAKMGALNKHYGVVIRQGDSIELSSLGKRIVYPDNEEQRSHAVGEMIMTVPLFRDLYKRIGLDFDPKTFPVHLRELTGIDRDVAAEESTRIAGFYREALPYLRDMKLEREDAVPASPEILTRRQLVQRSLVPEPVPEGTIRLEIPGLEPIVVPDKEHFINSLIEELKAYKEGLSQKSSRRSATSDSGPTAEPGDDAALSQ